VAPERCLAGLLTALVLLPASVHAEDEDRALSAFLRPRALPRGAAVDAIEWERRLRPADSLGPPPPRASDIALVPAARAGQDELVRELVKHGADLDRIGDDGFTALGAAAFAGRRSTVRLLLRAGADVQRHGASGQTALHLAALAGQPDTLDELLRAGVDIELLNRQRESALDVAAAFGSEAVMDRLLAAGADSSRAGRR